MNIVAIIALVIVFICGVFIMNILSRITKREKFIGFDAKIKREVIVILKSAWKRLMIILAIIVAMILIVITTFMGNGNKHETIMSVIAIATSIISLLSIFIVKRKAEKEFEIYFR